MRGAFSFRRFEPRLWEGIWGEAAVPVVRKGVLKQNVSRAECAKKL